MGAGASTALPVIDSPPPMYLSRVCVDARPISLPVTTLDKAHTEHCALASAVRLEGTMSSSMTIMLAFSGKSQVSNSRDDLGQSWARASS